MKDDLIAEILGFIYLLNYEFVGFYLMRKKKRDLNKWNAYCT